MLAWPNQERHKDIHLRQRQFTSADVSLRPLSERLVELVIQGLQFRLHLAHKLGPSHGEEKGRHLGFPMHPSEVGTHETTYTLLCALRPLQCAKAEVLSLADPL